MVLSGVPRKKSPVTPPGIDPGTSRLVAQRLNHYATPDPCLLLLLLLCYFRSVAIGYLLFLFRLFSVPFLSARTVCVLCLYP